MGSFLVNESVVLTEERTRESGGGNENGDGNGNENGVELDLPILMMHGKNYYDN